MESILLLINSTPSSPNVERAFQTALTLRAQGHAVSVFLLQDAVLAAVDRAYTRAAQALSNDIALYALAEDLHLRGFAPAALGTGVRAADYAQLVDLFAQHTRVVGAL